MKRNWAIFLPKKMNERCLLVDVYSMEGKSTAEKNLRLSMVSEATSVLDLLFCNPDLD